MQKRGSIHRLAVVLAMVVFILVSPNAMAGKDITGPNGTPDGICDCGLYGCTAAQCDKTSCPDLDCQAAKRIIKEDHRQGRQEIIDFIGESNGKQGSGGSGQFDKFEKWYINFTKQHIIRAMMMMTEQLSAIAHQQILAVGMFFDTQNKLSYHRTFQTLVAKAHKDYHPSRDFCHFGTNMRSLAHSDRISQLNKQALHKRQIARHLGTAPNIATGVAGAAKNDDDRESRWVQFLGQYCDPRDNNYRNDQANTGLDAICAPSNEKRVNADIDFTRMIESPRTLDINFTNDDQANDEEDILALSSNLYGHDVLSRNVDEDYLKETSSQELYLALRGVVAKRGVAENSFNAIVGLKSSGTTDVADTRDFLGSIMKELGVTDDNEIYRIIGTNPSYYAQLELLAKRLYQNPDFYADLYDKPANVKRKKVALKAIELMVDRAIYESQLRREMMTSVLLSAKLQQPFDKVNDALGAE